MMLKEGLCIVQTGSEVRITSGVELNFLNAKENEKQINESIKKFIKLFHWIKK